MAESTIGAEENGITYLKNVHTFQRTIGGTAKEGQLVLEGESSNVTYSAVAAGVSTTTGASHLLFIQGDGTNYGRMRRIIVQQAVAAGAATLAQLQLFRVSTAGSGGGAVSPRPFDSADTNPYGGTCQSLPSAKGTEGTQLWTKRLWLTNSIAAQPNEVEWIARPNMKPIIFGSATTDGLALKIVTGIASATVDIIFEFTLTSYL